MRLSGITKESIVDGPGIRLVLFVQGCPHGCPHCHNPESWSADGGKEYPISAILRMIKRPGPKRKPLRGITFSGGEPFMQAAELALAAFEAHRIGWDVVTYTGYLYEDLRDNPDADVQALLSLSDMLVDGPYIHEQRDIGLKFRGSDNQRLIDLEATRKKGRVVLFY
ncbi:MAG: anaerobic ribonucleoside-triphosphate reductase activating protein [Clostridiales bacterium]|nr:anaerobic ribonucleoside-triphosphate reductase activating protein [Clostridiales bacterium]